MRIVPVVAVLLILPSAPLRAQTQPTDRLVPGAWSLSFALPSGGGGSVGLWTMVSRRANLGVNLGFSFNRTTSKYVDSVSGTLRDDEVRWSIRVEPTVMLYQRLRPNVAPFLLGQIGASYGWTGSSSPSESTRWRTWSVYSRLGLGLEWFPVPAVSVNGWMAISIEAAFAHSRSNYAVNDATTFDAGTLTSVLALRIYP